jgi:hypothetical protein
MYRTLSELRDSINRMIESQGEDEVNQYYPELLECVTID